MKKETTSTISLVTLILILTGLAVYFQYNYDKSKSDNVILENLVNSLNDTVQQFKDKDGNNVSRISILEAKSAAQFLALNVKDSSIMELQKRVSNYKNRLRSMVDFESEGVVHGTVATIVDDSIVDKPVYRSSFTDKWIKLNVEVSDSTKFDLKYADKYSVAIINENKRSYVEVTSLSPYSTTGTVRAFQLAPQTEKRFSLSLTGGYGLLVDMKNNNVGYGPFIGIGASYKLINF